MKKDGVLNPYQYGPCVNCGKPARRYKGSRGRCAECYRMEVTKDHGTENTAKRCHCDECRAAAARARQRRRVANPAARERANAKRMERYYASKASNQDKDRA